MEIRFSSLPKFSRGYECVILLKALFIEEMEDEIITDEITYTWNHNPDDLRILCWIGDSFSEVGEAGDLVEALKIACEDLYEWVNEFYPEVKIKVVQD